MLLTAMGLAGAKVLELHLVPTIVLFVTLHVCACVTVCVYLCSVNYAPTSQGTNIATEMCLGVRILRETYITIILIISDK